MTSGMKIVVFFVVLLVFVDIAFEWYKEILDIQTLNRSYITTLARIVEKYQNCKRQRKKP